MKRNDAMFLIGLISVLVFVTKYSTTLGLPSGIGTDLIEITPGIVVTFFSFRSYVSAPRGVGSISLLGVGLGVALFMGYMDTMGLVTVDMFYGLTIAQLQTWIIILSAVLAGIDYYRH